MIWKLYKHYFSWRAVDYIGLVIYLLITIFLFQYSLFKYHNLIATLFATLGVVFSFFITCFRTGINPSSGFGFNLCYIQSLPITRSSVIIFQTTFFVIDAIFIVLWMKCLRLSNYTHYFKSFINDTALFSVIVVFFLIGFFSIFSSIQDGRKYKAKLPFRTSLRNSIIAFFVYISFMGVVIGLAALGLSTMAPPLVALCFIGGLFIFDYLFLMYLWKHEWVSYIKNSFSARRDYPLVLIGFVGICFAVKVFIGNKTNMYGDHDFFVAIKENNTAEINKYLTSKKFLNIKGKYNFIPLTAAAHEGNFELYKKLEEAGAIYQGERFDDKEDKAHHGMDLLFLAVDGKSHELVEYLLQKGFDVNSVNPEFGYPLINLVANRCDTKILEVLIKFKVNVNVQNTTGNTPVQAAVRGKCLEALILLKEVYADFKVKNKEGKNALDIAKELKRDQAMILFIEQASGVR